MKGVYSYEIVIILCAVLIIISAFVSSIWYNLMITKKILSEKNNKMFELYFKNTTKKTFYFTIKNVTVNGNNISINTYHYL